MQDVFGAAGGGRCVLPYPFEKGFTGDSGGSRKKAAGVGLSLADEAAKDLAVTLHANSEWGNGFEMQLSSPIVEKSHGRTAKTGEERLKRTARNTRIKQ